MKTVSFFSTLLFSCFFLIGCDNMTVSTGDGSHKVSGSGKVISEKRDVQPFTAISIEGVFNVQLEQGNKEAVRVETDENILPLIETIVEHDTLKLRLKDNTSIRKTDKLDVKITLVNITALRTAGVGTIECVNVLHLNELNVKLEGVGATELKMDVEKLNVKSDIVGVLKLSGRATEASINHNGMGAIEGFKLKTKKMSLRTDGIGGADVFASEELTVDANGVGGVAYRGGATKKQIKNNGVGKVVCDDCN